MARRILVRGEDRTVELVELAADNEVELQDVLRQAPNLIPINDLGLDGPMMVIGRETALPSGQVDLLGVTPTGDILIIEFKTGPKNPDYRHALAQLLDYGADLWQMDPEEFDTTATVSYLDTQYCPADDPARGAASLREAARRTWPHLEEAELDAFEHRIAARLADGGFHFVLAAQRITRNSRSTIEYLQQTHSTGSFHAVELVKFTDHDRATVAYEGRAVTSPAQRPGQRRHASSAGKGDPDAVLAAVDDVGYRAALEELLEYCRGLQLSFEAGAVGFSIRVGVPDRREPVSLGWLFPPGASGWMGLTGLNLGCDTATVHQLSVAHHFMTYAERLHQIEGVEQVHASGLQAVRIPPALLTSHRSKITEAIGQLVAAIGEAG
jgi:hypothetical protein